jgi:hypothetical protein
MSIIPKIQLDENNKDKYSVTMPSIYKTITMLQT